MHDHQDPASDLRREIAGRLHALLSAQVQRASDEFGGHLDDVAAMTGEDTMPAPVLTPDQARELRQQHDAYVKDLWRKPASALAVLYRRELAVRGQHLLYGGPASKDELTNAIVALRYPAGRLNEAIHVLHHGPAESWSACPWCHPHQGQQCECEIGRAT